MRQRSSSIDTQSCSGTACLKFTALIKLGNDPIAITLYIANRQEMSTLLNRGNSRLIATYEDPKNVRPTTKLLMTDLRQILIGCMIPVEYIPNCPLQVTGNLSGRGSQPQELGHIDPRGNIQGEMGNARSLR